MLAIRCLGPVSTKLPQAFSWGVGPGSSKQPHHEQRVASVVGLSDSVLPPSLSMSVSHIASAKDVPQEILDSQLTRPRMNPDSAEFQTILDARGIRRIVFFTSGQWSRSSQTRKRRAKRSTSMSRNFRRVRLIGRPWC